MATGRGATPPTGFDVRGNRVLAGCPEECLRQLSYFAPVNVRPGDILHDLHEPPAFVYFPVNFTAALVNALPSGHTALIGVVGSEGAIGIGSVLGGGAMGTRAIVQTDGAGVRIEAARVRDEFERGTALNRLLVRYIQALIGQISQTVICTKHHSPEQQLCRWLLLTLDRTGSTELAMTHELIGTILGLRRETVSETIHKLEARGLVVHRRKHLDVVSRQGLESGACSCYGIIREEYALLLPQLPSAESD